MTTPYDSAKAKVANQLIQNGIPLAQALAQAGIDPADAGNYGIYEGRVVAADFNTAEIPSDTAPTTGYSEAQTEAVPIADIQTRSIGSNDGGYPARPNTYVPPTGVDRFPAPPTQDDEINQAIAEQRARLGVPASSIASSAQEQAAISVQQSGTPVPVQQYQQATNYAPLEQATPEPNDGVIYDANGNPIGYTTRGIRDTITQGPVEVIPGSQEDPYAGARALSTPAASNFEPDPVGETNALGVTSEFTGVRPFEPNVSTDDPLSAQSDGIGETNALGITGEARVGPFAQINPYADAERSTAPIIAEPDAVDVTRSGLPQPRDSVGTFTNEEALANDETAANYAQTEDARQQQTIRSQRSAFNSRDWRVRLSLAPQARYLYKVAATGDILNPLRWTDGVIFPYTPNIQINYRANYEPYDMVHSNIRGLFYKNSSPAEISITGVFTAQDTNEANYLLAVIHFFRSCTKMFYGQDANAGTPPPLVYLSGYGDYQFSEHPCVISNFNYHLPADVDYIRARSVSLDNTNLVTRRSRQTNTPSSSPIYSAISRLKTIFMPKGALPQNQSSQPYDTSGTSVELGGETPTYVPTQMEIQLTMYPIQSRSQMSKQFSLDKFAQGDLLKGGFW
jgi:hypothetical protein